MDIQRPASVARQKKLRRISFAVAGVIVVGLVSVVLARLKPAAPTVERATVWVDTVKRGSMLVNVRGLGTLVPVDEARRIIPAVTQGRVERIVLRPGAIVEPDTIVLEMTEPTLQQSLSEAEQQLRAAEADYNSLETRLATERLNQRAAAATVEADYKNAELQKAVDSNLHKEGLLAQIQMDQSTVRAASLGQRNKIEQERVQVTEANVKAQLLAQQARIDQLRSLRNLRQQQVDQLKVRAGMNGVLEQVTVNVGQQVTPGLNLARVADPTRLKAELRIAETQARDLAIGQKAKVDTRNGFIEGKVIRIDPAAQQGTVSVDVELIGELPRGARPDLSVDGEIEIIRLDNVLHVGRPAFGQEQSTGGTLQGRYDHGRSLACAGATGPQLGQHDRDPRRARRRRSGRALGYVGVGSVPTNSVAVRDWGLERSPGTFAVKGVSMNASGQPLIKLDGIKKVFYTDEVETHALAGIHLEIQQGEYVAIAGPSGCGKSTLLAILGLLDTPTEGQYTLNGNQVANLSLSERARVRNREIGFIFQSFNLIGDLTVFENVELPLIYRGMKSAERRERANAALERVGMAHRSKHLPSQLSGGQQQRVAVARAVGGQPSILLADEPTGNLDSKNGEAVMDLLRELHRQGATICMVTHDPRYAAHADRSVHLFDGRIVEESVAVV